MFHRRSVYGGFIQNPLIRRISVWWPALTAIMFTTFFVFDERTTLGWSQAVWDINRLLVVIVSLACLVFLHNAKWRDILGLTMLWYGATASTSYYYSVPHDNAFWGEIVRLIVMSLLVWLLTVQSALVLRQQEIEDVIVMPEEDLDRIK